MFSYYTLIAEPSALSLQTHFYRVAVGNNATAHKALFALSRFCSQKGYYLQIRSREDDIFRIRVAQSLGCSVYQLLSMSAKVELLVSHIVRYGDLPWCPDAANNLHYMMAKTSPSYLLFNMTKCLKRGTF